MKWRWQPLLCCAWWVASTALAEAPWATSRGRLSPEMRLELWGGTQSVGAGVVRPDSPDARAAWGGELSVDHQKRFLELRGARQWVLTAPRFATLSAAAGASLFLVPDRAFEAGLGPHAGLTLALGGNAFFVDLGIQTSVEAFARDQSIRFPQRLQLGLNGRLGKWTLALLSRTGMDLAPRRYFTLRAEAVLAIGWLGI